MLSNRFIPNTFLANGIAIYSRASILVFLSNPIQFSLDSHKKHTSFAIFLINDDVNMAHFPHNIRIRVCSHSRPFFRMRLFKNFWIHVHRSFSKKLMFHSVSIWQNNILLNTKKSSATCFNISLVSISYNSEFFLNWKEANSFL